MATACSIRAEAARAALSQLVIVSKSRRKCGLPQTHLPLSAWGSWPTIRLLNSRCIERSGSPTADIPAPPPLCATTDETTPLIPALPPTTTLKPIRSVHGLEDHGLLSQPGRSIDSAGHVTIATPAVE